MSDSAAPASVANFSEHPQRVMRMPYFEDPVAACHRLRPLGHAVLLDSGDAPQRARWDILAARPEPGQGLYLPSTLSGMALHDALQRFKARLKQEPTRTAGAGTPAEVLELPFVGGYIGHLSYELGRRLQGLPAHPVDTPLAVVHHYPWAIVQDHSTRCSWLVGRWSDSLRAELSRHLAAPSASRAAPFRLTSRFGSTWTEEGFAETFQRVQDYIHAGDVYQVNIGQAFTATFTGDLLEAYARLREVARAPFSAFMPLDDHSTLLSLSPERFLRMNGGQIETRPIKGTRPRSRHPDEDRAAAAELAASPKERAENLMIVDLLRNDLGRFCSAGSIRVDELFSVESYATVHHLVSAVRGRLRDDVSPFDVLLGCLPGGSITGAPKRRAMEVIDELEAAPRGPWCGCVFYLSEDGRLDSNLAIRSPYSRGDQLRCWAGGGLVADSLAAAEYAEQQHKVGALLAALEAGSALPASTLSTREASGR